MLFGLDSKITILNKYCEIFYKLDESQLEKFKELSIYPTFLFYGYPATGKSSVANILYENLKKDNNIDIYRLNIDELLSSNFGESSHNLRNYFSKIKKDIEDNNSHAFIIMDEVDSFTLNRSQVDNESIKRVLLTFNTIIDELIKSNDIFKYIIVATTNLEKNIDTSIHRRFYFKENFNIELDEEIFQKFIKELSDFVGILINENDMIYKYYQEKKYTLGELKNIFSRYYIDTLAEINETNIVEKLKEYMTFHQIMENQK